MLYDSLLLFAVTWAVTAIAIALRVATVGNAAIRDSGAAAVTGPLLQTALAGAAALFLGWFWTRTGQTLGMQAWRLRIDSFEGGRIGWQQVVLRIGGALLSAACLGLGFWWILIDGEKLAWHDRISRSRVVVLAAKSAPGRA
jgi:uncharacterized RDD family membrane protein YckC